MKAAEEDRTELQPTSLERKLGQEGSALSRYQRAVIGRKGLLTLFLYEVINFFILPLPGKPGIWLRRIILPYLLGETGRNISMGANCTVRNGAAIFIGASACIAENATLDVKPGDNRLSIGDRVHIGRMTIFNCNGGKIEIGDSTEIGEFCRLGSLQGLTVGRHCTIGDRCCLSGASHAFADIDVPIIQQPITCKGATVIGNHVTLGEDVTVLDGVTIGDNVTILGGSLVNKNIADDQVAGGVPARSLDPKHTGIT